MALLRATTASTPLRLPPARHCDLNSNQLAMGDQQPSGNAPRAKRNRKPTTPFVPGETALRSRPTQQESAFKQLQPLDGHYWTTERLHAHIMRDGGELLP